MAAPGTSNPGAWPARGWVGLGLIAAFWPVNWLTPGLRTHLAFFPLWLGYCLAVDALVFKRRGHSLWSRNRGAYLGLFLASMPAWWLFELLNRRTENWTYVGREFFPDWQYAILASVSFSTVMPAVFGTAEWVRSWRWVDRVGRGPVISAAGKAPGVLFLAGWLMLAAVLVWPKVCFPLVWGAVFGILEPINLRLGNRTLLAFTARGDWRPILALGIGALVCGFFWEMWNILSYPKWVYHVPGVDWLRIFEMPLLGYGGYLPFALELFALYHFLARLARLPVIAERSFTN